MFNRPKNGCQRLGRGERSGLDPAAADRNDFGDNEFQPKSWFYCTRQQWLKVEARGSPELQQEQAMRSPKPFTVYQPVPAKARSRSSPFTPIRSIRRGLEREAMEVAVDGLIGA